MNEFNFYLDGKFLSISLQKTAEKLNFCNFSSVCLLFVGSDGNIGDSLAPVCGTLFAKEGCNFPTYGSLECPITAKEVPFVAKYLKKAHPECFLIVVDAAMGKKGDIGRIKVVNGPIKPGLGVNKDLPAVGDLSVIGVVGEKGEGIYGNLAKTRLSLVYSMALEINKGLKDFLGVKSEKYKQFKEIL